MRPNLVRWALVTFPIILVAICFMFVSWLNTNVFDSLSHRQQVIETLDRHYDLYTLFPERNSSELTKLENACASTYRFERTYAMSLLAKVSQHPDTSLAVLANGLNSNDPFTRKSAARALLSWKAGAKPVTLDLIDVVEERYDESAGQYAAEALGAIGNPSTEVLECLVRATCRENSLAAEGARRALRALDPM